MMNILFFILYLMITYTCDTVNGMNSISMEDLELERQLNLLNKPPVKSIHTKLGYIVDCIDIYNQSAFDNPLLKNHKLQKKPSFEKNISKTSVKISQTKSTIVLEKVRCPIRTVPVRRITKDDLIRAKTLFNDYILDDKHYYDTHVYLNSSDGPYKGVSGTTSAYHPQTSNGQASASVLYIKNGVNSILVGWHVFSELYGNDQTHIFSLWASGNQTGCFNTYCSGFVQTDTSYYLGSQVKRTSDGDELAELPVSLLQDPTSKNWWLTLLDKKIGYFPANLFSNMDVAEEVGWGGFTISPAGVTSPPMGSGKFPDKSIYGACYFRDVSYRNAAGTDITNFNPIAHLFINCPRTCYDVAYYGNDDKDTKVALQFGGPGGDNCG